MKRLLLFLLALLSPVVSQEQGPEVRVFYLSPQSCDLLQSFIQTSCQPHVMILTRGFTSEYLGITLIYADHGTSNVRYASQFVPASPGAAVFQIDRHISVWSVKIIPLSKSGPEVVSNPPH